MLRLAFLAFALATSCGGSVAEHTGHDASAADAALPFMGGGRLDATSVSLCAAAGGTCLSVTSGVGCASTPGLPSDSCAAGYVCCETPGPPSGAPDAAADVTVDVAPIDAGGGQPDAGAIDGGEAACYATCDMMCVGDANCITACEQACMQG